MPASSPHQIDTLPVIDIAPLVQRQGDARDVASQIRIACQEVGFFYVTGHGVDAELIANLEALSRKFFALPLPEKMQIPMSAGGRAWRGFFPVGQELTSGRPDQKEGLYFGTELPSDHPDVLAGHPFHGANLVPDMPGFAETLQQYLDALTQLGHTLARGLSLSLELPDDYFDQHYTRHPLVLFRIFNYPQQSLPTGDAVWGVGEHTDYGILTILHQDQVGGLQVKSQGNWIEAPPIPGTFVCNIGDMLDRMTGGLFRSTPHRVRNTGPRDRLSLPFFFDPNFHARVRPIDPTHQPSDDAQQRWDAANVHDWHGTYGEYLLSKVSKVFPELRRDAL